MVDRIGAVDFRSRFPECSFQPAPFGIGQYGAFEHQNVAILPGFIEDIGKVRKTGLQAHHMPFAQGIDWRIGDLAEILAKELADDAGLVRNHRKRGIVAHAADRLFPVLDHGREDHFHILQRHAGSHLAPCQFRARPVDRRILCLRKVGDCAETTNQGRIVLFGGNPILEFAVAIEFSLFKVDGNHLARAKAALFDDGVFRNDDHPGFRTDDQQPVIGAAVAQRAQRVAVDPGDRPMPVGHRQRGRAIPRLHHARHIFVHRLVVGGQVGVGLPSFGDQHQLCRWRFLA